MTFENLNLSEILLTNLKKKGYEKPTPIQEKAIPHFLENRDIFGCAQTGTGKTAAFALPIIDLTIKEKTKGSYIRNITTLILSPTRELALQISESFAEYGYKSGVRHTAIFGGVSQRPQVSTLRSGIDVLIATPGRLLDLMNQKFINLSNIKRFILDEADRMLDMGFITDVTKIISKLPKNRHTSLFSATIPDEILKLSDSLLNDPVNIRISPPTSTVDKIDQSVYLVQKSDKKSLLIHLLNDRKIANALIFTRTKRTANRLSDELNDAGFDSDSFHGNKSQAARQSALNKFKSKKLRILVATDIASRGIDAIDLPYVFNYDLPEDPETYIHRIGRTGRAGLSGTAVSFCDNEEKGLLRSITKHISKSIDTIIDHPFYKKIIDNNQACEKKTTNFRRSKVKKVFNNRQPRFATQN